MSTFVELQDAALGSSFPEAKRTNAKRFINDAVGRVHRKLRLQLDEATTTLTTTADDNTVDLPAGFLRARSAFFEDLELEPVSPEYLEAMLDESGEPEMVAYEGGDMTIWPTPDDAYDIKLRYFTTGDATLTADGDTPSAIPSAYHDILWKWARADLFADEDDAEMATFWDSRAQTRLSELAVDDADESDEVKQVEGTF